MADPSLFDRQQGCIYGLMIGDALAMPAHWYYDTAALARDYGDITGYVAPRNPHPDSILWRSSYQPLHPRADILHDQAAYWGQRGIHYHQFLSAGENTLNLKLCMELLESLAERRRYDRSDYLSRYVAFMTTPGRHRDTYVEECHRHFFQNLGRGLPPDRCGVPEKHIGGLVGVVPIAAWHAENTAAAIRDAMDHVGLTHHGSLMKQGAALFARLLGDVLQGQALDHALLAAIERQDSLYLGHPFHQWVDLPDETVIGAHLSSACYVQFAVPAVLHLALKYANRPAAGLLANVRLGGDSAHRGALLGAMLGAAHGITAFPIEWVNGLGCRDHLERILEAFRHDVSLSR